MHQRRLPRLGRAHSEGPPRGAGDNGTGKSGDAHATDGGRRRAGPGGPSETFARAPASASNGGRRARPAVGAGAGVLTSADLGSAAAGVARGGVYEDGKEKSGALVYAAGRGLSAILVLPPTILLVQTTGAPAAGPGVFGGPTAGETQGASAAARVPGPTRALGHLTIEFVQGGRQLHIPRATDDENSSDALPDHFLSPTSAVPGPSLRGSSFLGPSSTSGGGLGSNAPIVTPESLAAFASAHRAPTVVHVAEANLLGSVGTAELPSAVFSRSAIELPSRRHAAMVARSMESAGPQTAHSPGAMSTPSASRAATAAGVPGVGLVEAGGTSPGASSGLNLIRRLHSALPQALAASPYVDARGTASRGALHGGTRAASDDATSTRARFIAAHAAIGSAGRRAHTADEDDGDSEVSMPRIAGAESCGDSPPAAEVDTVRDRRAGVAEDETAAFAASGGLEYLRRAIRNVHLDPCTKRAISAHPALAATACVGASDGAC